MVEKVWNTGGCHQVREKSENLIMKAEINTLKLKVREKKRNKNVCSVRATEPNSVRFGVLCSKLHFEQWIEEQVFMKKCNFS